jgi:hypothetical protein
MKNQIVNRIDVYNKVCQYNQQIAEKAKHDLENFNNSWKKVVEEVHYQILQLTPNYSVELIESLDDDEEDHSEEYFDVHHVLKINLSQNFDLQFDPNYDPLNEEDYDKYNEVCLTFEDNLYDALRKPLELSNRDNDFDYDEYRDLYLKINASEDGFVTVVLYGKISGGSKNQFLNFKDDSSGFENAAFMGWAEIIKLP